MDGQAKRLCLIKSGAEVCIASTFCLSFTASSRSPLHLLTHTQKIPKRRKGARELDLALLEYLDETVRRDARIALAIEGKGGTHVWSAH